MKFIHQKLLNTYRNHTFNLAPGQRLCSPQEAINYVNQRGFIFFWPIKNTDLPSLWVATTGDRPVPNQHDDPGHITWRWKDELMDKRVWYYARLLRKRNTIASLDIAADFYALSPNYGDYYTDYLQQYEQGLLTLESKKIYEAILREGQLHAIALRKAANLSNTTNETRFNRALDTLQIEMKILPVGIAQAGAWRYAFIYDLVPRHFPDLLHQAQKISELQARCHLIDTYLKSVGAAPSIKIKQLFGWSDSDLQRAIQQLVENGKASPVIPSEKHGNPNNKATTWLCIPELLKAQ